MIQMIVHKMLMFAQCELVIFHWCENITANGDNTAATTAVDDSATAAAAADAANWIATRCDIYNSLWTQHFSHKYTENQIALISFNFCSFFCLCVSLFLCLSLSLSLSSGKCFRWRAKKHIKFNGFWYRVANVVVHKVYHNWNEHVLSVPLWPTW